MRHEYGEGEGMNGEKRKKDERVSQHSWRYLFISRVRKRYTILRVKYMYNLQTKNYFNNGARYRANGFMLRDGKQV